MDLKWFVVGWWYNSNQHNSFIVNIPVTEDMDHCRKISEHFSSSSVEETDLFLPSSRPRWLSSLYTDLTVTDCKDRKEAPPPTYLCIPIKTDVNCKYFNVETETKRVS